MNTEFDPQADVLYVTLAVGDVATTREVDPGVLLDVDSGGNALGIEVLCVSQRQAQPAPITNPAA